jgi:hypothetical protein
MNILYNKVLEFSVRFELCSSGEAVFPAPGVVGERDLGGGVLVQR